MSMVIPMHKPGPDADVPSVSSLPAGTKRGYLWRLSGRRMLYKTDWKRKYFVLHQDRLYYYETERGQAGERGSGLIELKYFIDCVEAPLTDHKKATNVFLLLAAERGFFDQGRCYLSAETLIDMKDWVTRIRTVLEGLQGKEESGPVSLPSEVSRAASTRRPSVIPEPLYASIREESIHRSNSLSTLPSLCREPLGEEGDWHNRSMDEGPVCGLGGVDHNLTYNYSSSEESLNESFSIVIGQKLPRSAESSMRRSAVARPRPEITLQAPDPGRQDLYEEVGSSYSTFPRHSSPAKKSTVKSSSDYLQKMYSEMARVDEQLEMVSRIETDGGSLSGVSSISSQPVSEGTVQGNGGSQSSLHKMEQMLKQVVRQSEELYGVFRQLESESATRGKSGEETAMLPGAQALTVRLARYQGSLVALERQATDLMGEIKATHTRVIQSLEEAEQARNDFLQLKEKAEFILSQLQGEASRHGGSQTAQVPRQFQLYEPVAPAGSNLLPQGTQTFPKQKKGDSQGFARSSQESDSGSSSMSSGRGRVNFCQDPHHPSQPMHQQGHQLLQQSGPPTQEPVYAQPVKKADREKEKSEQSGVYSKPSYEVQAYRQTRNSPQSGKRYSTYSPKSERYGGPVSPLAKEERYSPCKSTNPEERGSPLRIPLAQEEQYSPGPEGRPSPKMVPSRNMSLTVGNGPRNVNVATGSAVIYAHRKETAARPRSLQFQAAVKRD